MITRLISPFYQRTIHDSFSCVGYGLQTGLKIQMKVMPSEANSGYTFVRHDVDNKISKVIANDENVTDFRLSTTVSNSHGVEVNSVNQLLAALYSCNIDNALIVLEGPEVPCIDGSAQPFVALIQEAGFIQQNADRNAIVIKCPITISDEINFCSFLPHKSPSASIIKYSQDKNKQVFSSHLSEEVFKNDIAPARLFADQNELNTLFHSGRAQGVSLENTILHDDDCITNTEKLRFEHEYIRYRVQEHIANLALIGVTIFGEFNGVCSSHNFKNKTYGNWLEMNEDAFERTTLKEALTNYHDIVT
ncbi:MAG: UDP-3-O-acyl-N-acetylglucosamine deacetylase [Gammaproteobacteria bacterium]